MSGRMRDDAIRDLAIAHGVPANPISFAATAEEAARAALDLGRPVAVKLVAEQVIHKSRAGGVLLDVAPESVRRCVTDLFGAQRINGIEPTGVTVEPMVPPGIEVVIGAVHSPGFGPAVMFGTGGVDLEILQDVAFALAPLTRGEAKRLIGDTAGGRVVMSRHPARVDDLVDVLMAVAGADGMLFEAAVTDIDLNPVIVHDTGVVAVDARARALPEPLPPVALPDPEELHDQLRPAIYPHSVAILGASADPSKMGNRVVRQLVDFGFAGKIYPISAKAETICGLETVPDIETLPGDVDRAVVAVPAAAVPTSLERLAAVGVRTTHVHTAETPPIEAAALRSGMRVIGPNCIGHYTPHAAVTMIEPTMSSRRSGRVAFISQSGTYAGDAVRRGAALGLDFSFVSSVGNCEDVSPSEFLAFCAADERTEVIAFYLEGDRGADEFFRLAKGLGKPVVLLQGGRTTVGGAAAASHTGALASDPRLLEGAARQAGVLLVDDLDQLFDTLLVLQSGKPPTGDGLALVGSGGGVAVVGADRADGWGLGLPELADITAGRLAGFAAPGASLANPIDIPVWSLFSGARSHVGSIVTAVSDDPGVHAVCVFVDLGTVFDMHVGAEGEAVVELLAEDLLAALRSKAGAPDGPPVVVVWRSGLNNQEDDVLRRLRTEFAAQGIPVLDSVDRAVTALGGARWLSRGSGERDGASSRLAKHPRDGA